VGCGVSELAGRDLLADAEAAVEEKFAGLSSNFHNRLPIFGMRLLSGLLRLSASYLAIAPMSRRRFEMTFVVLAMVFVPVLFWFGLADLKIQCACQIFNIVLELLCSPGRLIRHWEQVVTVGVYLAVYGGLFYGAARLSYWGSNLFAGRLRWLAQVVILSAVVSCSFIRAIEYSALNYGGSGTYNFWEACVRYSKTHGQLLSGKP